MSETALKPVLRPILEAWASATGRSGAGLERAFRFWLMSYLAINGLTDRAALLEAARRCGPQTKDAA